MTIFPHLTYQASLMLCLKNLGYTPLAMIVAQPAVHALTYALQMPYPLKTHKTLMPNDALHVDAA